MSTSNKSVTAITIVAAIIGIAGSIGAYAIIPYRLDKDEKDLQELRVRQENYNRDVVEIKIMIGRLEERSKALEVMLNARPFLPVTTQGRSPQP